MTTSQRNPNDQPVSARRRGGLRLAGRIISSLVISPCSLPLAAAEPADAETAAMMERLKRATSPGPKHVILHRFLGRWDYELRTFTGGAAAAPEKGTAEVTWLVDGRWIKSEDKGTMMGRPYQGFMVMGYDNFKQAFVSTYVSNADTTMARTEGQLNTDETVLTLFGTTDDFMSGRNDKPMRYLWRFVTPEKRVLELHDLSAGETGTKIAEITYTRRN